MLVLQPRIFAIGSLFWHLPGHVASILLPGSSKSIPESLKGGKAAERDSNVEVFEQPKMIEVEPPSSEPYQLHGSTADMHRSQFKQDYKLEPLLTQIKDGFFVESGAHDGEAISNTLYFESIGWQGLLIEPGNDYGNLRKKNRKAWSFHGALSPTGKSEMVNFAVDKHAVGEIIKSNGKGNVQAEPLAQILAAISPTRTTVDFWSLDIEGAECDVLQTTDFEKITVGILLIEMNKVGGCVARVMRERGFILVGHLGIDDLFVNPKYMEDKGLVIPESLKGGKAAERDSNVEVFGQPKMIEVEPPSSEPYQLHGSTADMHRSQFKQDHKLEPLLTQIKDGFFVESGAHDGEAISNTLYFESIGWQGLLIEPGNDYGNLRKKNRKAWSFHGALSPTGKSEMVNFAVTRHVLGQIIKSNGKGNVQAEPLAKILAAISPTRTTVDFWSLDIEGAECDVLQTTDFEKITVGILLIEMNKVGGCVSKVMKERGFVLVGHVAIDDLFVNPKYMEDKGLVIPESLKGGKAAERDSNVEVFEQPKMIEVEPPSSEPYQLHGSTADMHRSQFKQDSKLEPLLTQIKDGFFVESGAHDGEAISNTLYFESIGWQGLLIEPGNDYGNLRKKNRKAWSFHGALSPTGKSEMVNFAVTRHVLGQIIKSNGKGNVQAEPLAKILAAISPTRTTVDFWSLDIEGAECDVLQTTDFEKITVGILLIEMNKVGGCVARVMRERGFILVGHLGIDDLFANPRYMEDKGLVIPESLKGGKAAERDSNVEVFEQPKMIEVEPPSSEPYQLHGSTADMHRSQFKQDYKLEPLLTQIKDGFFVESGAHDGEAISNTLYYESIGWQGLLIEPGNDYGNLRKKNRKAWSFHGALSPTGKSEMVNFAVTRHVLGEIIKSNGKGNVQAEPLAKILAAISPTRTTVDFWSLDIEGAECDVLQTTDFEKITVGILLIEMNKVGVCVARVMRERGFILVGHLGIDDLFANPRYMEDKGLVIPESLKGGKAAERDSNVEVFEQPKMIEVEPPSSEPYQLHGSTADMHRSQFKQDYKLEPLLTQIKDGFFVESGAHDGEAISNTLYYESIGWQGLLIEPGNDYGNLRKKNRKAWSFHGALSPTGKSEMVNFAVTRHVLGQIIKSNAKGNVQAEPLAKILAAISPTRTTVDFWSLDIEGAECDVLQTTDFEKITVGILLIEMNKVGGCVSKVMKERGFVRVGHVAIDDLFVNPKYVENKGLVIPESLKGAK